MRNRVRAVPAWAWVGAIVAVSTVVRFAFARHMVGPWIMIDEIVYSELAKSFAATGSFAVREVPTGGYGVVYPILISPAYALFRSIPTVYSAVKLINALLMSLTAVPAYLLARRVVSMRGALIVAVLAVAVPSTFYAGTVMTENAFYPIFVLLALALVALLERPRLVTVVFFLAATALAYETRAQAVAVVPAALLAPLLIAALARRPRELLRYKLLYAAVGGIALLAVLAEVARGRSVSSLLGAYAAATHSSYDVGTVSRWLLWHLSELQLYVGVVPVFALVLLCVQGKALSSAERAVVAATVSLVAFLAVEVAAFASQPSVLRIEERNLFYVAPLLFTCLVLWIERGMPRPRGCDRGGRGGSRCAGGGRSVRAVHRHVGDLGHVRRARALVDRGLAARACGGHSLAGRRGGRGPRSGGGTRAAAALVGVAGCRVPALPRRDAAGRQQDAARFHRCALPGDHQIRPRLDHGDRRVERPSPGRRPLDRGDRQAHRERERVLQSRRRADLYDERCGPGRPRSDARGGEPCQRQLPRCGTGGARAGRTDRHEHLGRRPRDRR